MKFIYSEFENPVGGKISRPMIPIVFKNQNKFIQTMALIDSGADFTILPIEIAGILNITLKNDTKTVFYGAGNNHFTVYCSPTTIDHIIRQKGFRPLKWQSKVYFAESQPTILLGQKGFLEYHRVFLDGKKRTVEIMPE